MKEVKELADLVEMQPRERDAWFAERFGRSNVTIEMIIVEGEEYLQVCSLDPFGIMVHVPKFSSRDIHALKSEMVKLGYSYEIKCSDIGVSVMFYKNSHELPAFDIVCDTEIEATWKAAALALLGEMI